MHPPEPDKLHREHAVALSASENVLLQNGQVILVIIFALTALLADPSP